VRDPRHSRVAIVALALMAPESISVIGVEASRKCFGGEARHNLRLPEAGARSKRKRQGELNKSRPPLVLGERRLFESRRFEGLRGSRQRLQSGR
jgi:hypothetical protein